MTSAWNGLENGGEIILDFHPEKLEVWQTSYSCKVLIRGVEGDGSPGKELVLRKRPEAEKWGREEIAMFSSTTFITLGFTSMLMIHFEVIFLCAGRYTLRFCLFFFSPYRYPVLPASFIASYFFLLSSRWWCLDPYSSCDYR